MLLVLLVSFIASGCDKEELFISKPQAESISIVDLSVPRICPGIAGTYNVVSVCEFIEGTPSGGTLPKYSENLSFTLSLDTPVYRNGELRVNLLNNIPGSIASIPMYYVLKGYNLEVKVMNDFSGSLSCRGNFTIDTSCTIITGEYSYSFYENSTACASFVAIKN